MESNSALHSQGHEVCCGSVPGDVCATNCVDAASWCPGCAGRLWWRAETLNDLSAVSETLHPVADSDRATANLVSSRCASGLHAPAVDIDFPCVLLDSSSPGHRHLYVDRLLTWRQYRSLLLGLYRSSLIDASVLWRSADRRSTFLRPPWVQKTAAEFAAGTHSSPADVKAARRALRRVKLRVCLRSPLWASAVLFSELFDGAKARFSVRQGCSTRR